MALNRRGWRRAAVALAVAGAMTLAACGSSSTPSDPSSSAGGEATTEGSDGASGTGFAVPTNEESTSAADGAISQRKGENKLVVIAHQDPGTLNYEQSALTALALWIPNIVEPLVYFDAEGEASGAVADKWDISQDGKTYTFHIRDGITFSNGAPVTADDVVYSLNQMKKSTDNKKSGPYGIVDSIAKVDDTSVTVTLKQASRSFFKNMGSLSGLIQPKAEAATIATNPIGTGPYKLVKYVPNDSITLTANTSYWGEQPKIPDVVIKIIEDQNAVLNALKAGEADLFAPAGAQFWSQITDEKLNEKFTLKTYSQSGEPTYAVINQKIDPAERQAIARTFDREAIRDLFNAPWGVETTCTWGEPDRAWYEPYSADSCDYPYDIEKAIGDVTSAGYADQELGFTSLTDVGDLKPPAEVLIAQMQAAGFTVKNNAIDLARYSQTVFSAAQPDFDVTVMAGSDDPDQWMCLDKTKAPWSTYCNEEYTALLQQADAASTEDEYNKIMGQAMDVLQKDAVIVPLVAKAGVALMTPGLSGWQDPNVFVGIRLADLHW